MPDELTAIIVDDEELGRRAIAQQLERHPAVRVVAECSNSKQAMASIAEYDADVVFLDIQMPLGSGFDVVEMIGSAARPAIVFVTAHDEYAVRAFDVHAVDYLLKPIDDARFDDALSRVRERLRRSDVGDLSRRMQAAWRALSGRSPTGFGKGNRVAIRDSGKVRLLWSGEIDWLEAEGNYVRVHVGRQTILARSTLQQMMETVNDPRFVRVHRSSVANRDAVSHIESAGKGLYILVLRDGSRVESSYHFRSGVMQLIKNG
jgi:two-component system LytT family response regulator